MGNDLRAVRQYLQSARSMHIEIQRLQAKERDLRAMCERVTAQFSGAPGGGGGTDRNDRLAAYADALADTTALIRQEQQSLQELRDFIDRIDAPAIEREMLRLKYLSYYNPVQIQHALQAAGYFISDRQMYRVQYNALQAAAAQWRGEMGPPQDESCGERTSPETFERSPQEDATLWRGGGRREEDRDDG